MIPAGAVLASAHRFYGERYSTANGRTSETSGFKDCSGLWTAAFAGVGIYLPSWATVSLGMERWCIDNGGRYVDKAYAKAHPAVMLFIKGVNSNGHVGASVGDNSRAFETPSGEGRKVGYSKFDRNRWQVYTTIPGVNHDDTSGTAAPSIQQEEDSMIWVAKNMDGSVAAFLVSGGIFIRQFGGGPGAFGIPQEALDYSGGAVLARPATWGEIDAAKKRAWNTVFPPASGGTSTPVDTTALAAAVVKSAGAKLSV